MPRALLALVAVCLASALPLRAAEKEASKEKPAAEAKPAQETRPPNPLTAKPPNPLLADPFIGEFEGDDLVLVAKAAGDKAYEGELRRSGKSFPFKVTRDGGRYSGAFTFEGFSYEFTAVFEGAALKVTTEEKEFSLSRRAKAPDKPPVTPVQPAIIEPVAPKPAAVIERVDYSKLTTAQFQQLSWTRFGTGSFVAFDEAAGTVALLQSSTATDAVIRVRSKTVLDAVRDGKAVLTGYQLDDKVWAPADRAPGAPETESLRIDELGYTRGESSLDSLVVENATIKCERTSYHAKLELKGAPMTVTAEIWRSKEIDKPVFTMDLPQQRRLLVEPGMARVQITLEFQDVKVNTNMEVASPLRDAVIDRQAIHLAVMKGTTRIADPRRVLRRTTEYWLSHQVPGGLVKVVETEEKGSDLLQRQTVLVAFEAKAKK